MDKIELKVFSREKIGKQHAKKIRKQGLVPSIVYAKDTNTKLTFQEQDFKNLVKNKSTLNGIIFSLVFESSKDNCFAVLKEYQSNPLTGQIYHIDFKKISLKDKIETKIPLILKGIPAGVKIGGFLQQHLREISVSCLPDNLPESYVINIEDLNVGDSLRISDLSVIEGLTITQTSDDIILGIVASRTSIEEEEKENSLQEPEVIGKKKEEISE